MTQQQEQRPEQVDVVVIGGGAAGLSAGLMLARSRRRVVVVDAGEPRNRFAEGVHGLLGHDGVAPTTLLATGREEVRRYGGKVRDGEVCAARRVDDGFEVDLADGSTLGARRIVVASGLRDELPDLPGVRERWGRDVLHCPYCHGWEVRDRAIGILAGGPMSVHQALLFSQLTDDVVFFSRGLPLVDEQAAQLAARSIRLVGGEVTAVEVEQDRLAGVRLADGTVVARDAVVVAPRMRAAASFLHDLGLVAVEHPSGVGVHVPADPTGRTDVPGVWAAGNVVDFSAQVGAAAAAGAMAGAQVNADLVMEETARAIESASQ